MILKPNYTVCGVYFPHKHILKFQSYSELVSDEDILNLFVGMVRLIKRSTELKLEAKYSKQIKDLTDRLKKMNATS